MSVGRPRPGAFGATFASATPAIPHLASEPCHGGRDVRAIGPGSRTICALRCGSSGVLPGLTFAALLALACGIGGTITVFTLVNAVVLRPLPVEAPEELVWLRDPSFSYPVFEQIRDRGYMLQGLFAWEPRTLHAAWTSEPEPTSMLLVTGAFHDTLGLRPAAGRLLNQADVGNTPAEAQAVAVLSYSAWQRRFSGDPGAVGRTLRIEGQPFAIVGVTPPGFFGVAVGMSPDVTIPVTMLPRLRSDERDALVERGPILAATSWAAFAPACRSRRPTPRSNRCGRRRWPRRSRPSGRRGGVPVM